MQFADRSDSVRVRLKPLLPPLFPVEAAQTKLDSRDASKNPYKGSGDNF
jgi:hypothetical protein